MHDRIKQDWNNLDLIVKMAATDITIFRGGDTKMQLARCLRKPKT